MKSIMILVGSIVSADSVDRILADEASKVERLKNVKTALVNKVEEVKQAEIDERVKLEAEIKKLQTAIVDGALESLKVQEDLTNEITKADKAIERLTK